MISKTFKYILLVVIQVMLIAGVSMAGEKDKKSRNSVSGVTGTPVRTYLNINNISTVIKNDGISDIDAAESNSGLVFPKGSGKQAVYCSGFLWGARQKDTLKVGGSAYRTGLQCGKILSAGIPDSLTLAKNRIYRVRPDVKPGGSGGDLSAEVADEGVAASSIRAQYEKDWTEWPAADGAPFKDVNNNGTYEPATDIPGVPGADQTIWYVANDLNQDNTNYLYGATPMGIELQVTIWAYAQTGALGNMFFRKYKMINKGWQTTGADTLKDVYVSMWSDVDLGNSVDDFSGCDTVLSLGYTYNANAVDDNYSPLPPPAVGFDFFQGPVVTGKAGQDLNKNGIPDSADYAIVNGVKIGPGKINLPMTAFYYFARGDASVTDPTQGAYAGTTQFYNFFQGKIGLSGNYFVDPNTNKATTYALSGDPQTRKGWIDGQQLPAGDRRIGSSSGPFTMAPGDVQEIVVAEICAGAIPGTDRLSAIGLLKFYDQQAQLAYDNNFDLPVAPPMPEVNTVQMNKQIVLDWGQNFAATQATENSNAKGYKFQGYNVYQLPSSSASLSEAKRLATYDIIDGIGKIEDKFFDPNTGVVAVGVRQFGNDNGIKRFHVVENDDINGGVPLVNGKRYYFAVTSYSYNPDPNAVPNNLENPLKTFTLVPNTENPGYRYGALVGDTIAVAHSKGISEGYVVALVTDPTKLTGHTYKVSFDTVGGVYSWGLKDVTANKVLLSQQVNQSGDYNYYTIDGLLIKVSGPATPGMKDWAIPSGTRRFTWANADGFGLEGFNGTIGNGYDHWFSGSTIDYSMMKNVLLKLSATDTGGVVIPGDPNISYAYRYLRRAGQPAADPSFVPFILSPLNTPGYAYQDFKKNFPFSAWDMEANPPRRLAVGYLENNVANGLVDGKYWPPYNGDASRQNVGANGPREWFFIFDNTYSETVDTNLSKDILNTTLPMQWMGTVARRQNATAWAAGDEFMIYANHINTLNDEFTIVAPKPSAYNEATAKDDVNKLNVFPNPYYGANPEELNKYNRFVTFSHLPAKATIRIFNLAGILVKTIEKNSTSQFERWDLANDSGLPVASGLYIAYIEMPDLGINKTLKVAIIQEQQILDRF